MRPYTLLLWLVGFTLLGVDAQAQTTFVVTSTGDASNGACGPGACTLRDAVEAANATAGTDTIEFGILGGGVHTIVLNSALPTVSESVTIDGYSQPGAAANTNATGALDAVLLIQLSGSAGYYQAGLTIGAAADATISGLVLNGFINDIHLETGSRATLAGCFLGTTPDGTAIASPTSDRGVLIDDGVTATIGGATAAARNLISGHGFDGIRVDHTSSAASSLTIAGNVIGTDITGASAIPNGAGIRAETTDGTSAYVLTIGGATAAEGNVISGNGVGIALVQTTGAVSPTAQTTIRGNLIGTNAQGAASVPNTGAGVTLDGQTTARIEANTIAHNDGAGVMVNGDTTPSGGGVRITQNAIFDNGALGIDLAGDGRTPNDADDSDTGPNGRQNFPVITRLTDAGAATSVAGSLVSLPNTTYTLEFFSNGTVDRSGMDGQTFVGSTTVMTNGAGLAMFDVLTTSAVPVGYAMALTATDPNGLTSELSDSALVRPAGWRISGTLTLGATPIPGVSVSLTGDVAATTTSDVNGHYAFDGLADGIYTLTPSPVGYTFTPDHVVISSLTADATYDFTAVAVPATYTVNSTADPGDGVCDAAECTLHEAMTQANLHPGPDAIAFDIPGAPGVLRTIALAGPLPAIADPLVLDGFTQPGATPNTNATGGLNAVPLIAIDGNGQTFGLGVGIGPTTIRGLVVRNFTFAALAIGNVAAPVSQVNIEGNFIGITAAGPGPRTAYTGILLLNDIHGVVIGGTLPAARNAISGYGGPGIMVTTGDVAATEVTIAGNLIGTTIGGDEAAPNEIGIEITNAGPGTPPGPGAQLRIGGSTDAERNVISGNAAAGIAVLTDLGPDPATADQRIANNFIGLSADGSAALPNGGDGIRFSGQPTFTVSGNAIAHNGGAGVRLATTTTPDGAGVTLSENAIYANTGIAVDLNGDGRTANDAGDADTGANETQNYPVITAAQRLANQTTAIEGSLDSRPNATYQVELFTTGGASRPGGDARVHVHTVAVMTDGAGHGTFTASVAGLAAGDFLTATATDAAGLTSELADTRVIAAVPVHTISGTITENGVGLAGITVLLAGDVAASTMTNGAGQYAFTGLPEGGGYIVRPTGEWRAFTPLSARVDPLASDRTVDFIAALVFGTQFLAEGATGPFWQTHFSVLNPTLAAADAEFRFMLADGQVKTFTLPMAERGHVTLDAATVAGLEQATFSTEIRSAAPIVAERTMRWGTDGQLGAHAALGVPEPRESWYFAEGATGCFGLFYLLQNATAQPADVDVHYLRRAPETPVTVHYRIEPHSRLTIEVNREPGLSHAEAAAEIQVTNGVPILAERAMYSSCYGATWRGGHVAPASAAPAMSWFLAEGATGSFFDLYVLIANFATQPADVDVLYLRDNGQTITRRHTIPPRSRVTIDVASEDERLAQTTVSTLVTSRNAVPVVVERAQWWPHGNWYEGHASAGATASGVEWQLAGGEAGGANGGSAYLLIANTGDADGAVQVRLMAADGAIEELSQPMVVRAHSRETLSIGDVFTKAAVGPFGLVVTSVGATPAPIVVELSNYNDTPWNGGHTFWGAGTNIVGTRIR